MCECLLRTLYMYLYKMCSAVIVLLLWIQVFVESIQILDLRVPGHVAEGGQALLGCQFNMEGDDLYSVKWYKDGREFYRYVPSSTELTSYFSMPGVFVDLKRVILVELTVSWETNISKDHTFKLTKSASTVVALEHLTYDSAGRYRCEVSGEAPYFVTVFDEKDISVHLLPNSGPQLTGVKNEYQVGDRLAVNCSSSRSRPRTQIKWLVNDQPVSENYLRGPWERTSRERADARETTLELGFTLLPQHFREGVLTLKCQASLAPLYQNEVIRHILRVEDTFPLEAETKLDKIEEYEETLTDPEPIHTFASQNEIISDNSAMQASIGVFVPLIYNIVCLINNELIVL